MQLEYGKKYIAKNGRVFGPMEPIPCDHPFFGLVSDPTYYDPSLEDFWYPTGTYWDPAIPGRGSELDLVSEYVEYTFTYTDDLPKETISDIFSFINKLEEVFA